MKPRSHETPCHGRTRLAGGASRPPGATGIRHLRRVDSSAIICLAVAVLASGCSYSRDGVPPEPLVDLATIPGIPRARFWGDDLPDWFDEGLELMRSQLLEKFTEEEMRLPSNYLVISGGGQNGAFGAGFLGGWTKSGQRPPFVIVTGVSTGALIAPFAFAGPQYDDTLRELYTTISTRDIVTKRWILSLLFGDSTADSAPLRRLIEKHVDEDLIRAIAEKYKEGRRLYVGTTNLDTERPVMWDISAIATSGAPGALDLIRDVLLASASIPGVFPPVYIEVEANGQRFQEIHVDGGATTQLFLYPAALDWRRAAERLSLAGVHRLYILRNGYLDPTYEAVEPRLTSILLRSIHSLIRTHSRGDLYRLYLGAQRDRIAYHLAYIPLEFKERPKEDFDPEYMSRLYELGYRQAAAGYTWDTQPPGFHPP